MRIHCLPPLWMSHFRVHHGTTVEAIPGYWVVVEVLLVFSNAQICLQKVTFGPVNFNKAKEFSFAMFDIVWNNITRMTWTSIGGIITDTLMHELKISHISGIYPHKAPAVTEVSHTKLNSDISWSEQPALHFQSKGFNPDPNSIRIKPT